MVPVARRTPGAVLVRGAVLPDALPMTRSDQLAAAVALIGGLLTAALVRLAGCPLP